MWRSGHNLSNTYQICRCWSHPCRKQCWWNRPIQSVTEEQDSRHVHHFVCKSCGIVSCLPKTTVIGTVDEQWRKILRAAELNFWGHAQHVHKMHRVMSCHLRVVHTIAAPQTIIGTAHLYDLHRSFFQQKPKPAVS